MGKGKDMEMTLEQERYEKLLILMESIESVMETELREQDTDYDVAVLNLGNALMSVAKTAKMFYDEMVESSASE